MKDRIVEEIKKLAVNKTVRLETVEKVNMEPQIGVCISDAEHDPSKPLMSPLVYINNFVHECEAGRKTPREVAEIILKAIEEITPISFEPTDFLDFNKVKGNIVARIVNAEKNASLLKRLACNLVLDFAIIYSYVMKLEDGEIGTINITNEHLKTWGITLEELDALAIKNTEREHQCSIKDMSDFPFIPAGVLKGYMYVLTNKSGFFGASVILYRNLLENIYRQIGPFYLLPSSVHEWILLPIIRETNEDDLKDLVCFVNRDILSSDDFLSDSVYYFDGTDLVIKK